MHLITPPEKLKWYPVSCTVSNSRNNVPECIIPVDLEWAQKLWKNSIVSWLYIDRVYVSGNLRQMLEIKWWCRGWEKTQRILSPWKGVLNKMTKRMSRRLNQKLEDYMLADRWQYWLVHTLFPSIVIEEK